MYYGWVIVGCAACASFARQGGAVATLSVFVAPMAAEFDWSRAGISGAVSLGGVLGALVAPVLGAVADRSGARVMLTASAIAVSLCAFALAGVQSLLGFYLAFGISRMLFAAPFDVGVATAITNWFDRRRSQAMSYVSVATGVSLAIMPLLAQAAIDAADWRAGWLAVGVAVLVVGAAPNAIAMRRRPEDLGLRPDGAPPDAPRPAASAPSTILPATDFTRAEALRTPTFWLLLVYTALAFCVQAGISLHQASHLVERGLSPNLAASSVAAFSLTVAFSSLAFGIVGDRYSVRVGLALPAALLVVAALAMARVEGVASAFGAAIVFGLGIGGLMTLSPVAFATYFGRTSYGAIRGIALPVQVLGQACGPIMAGVMHDLTGSYTSALHTFAGIAGLAALVVWAAPGRPERRA